MIISKIMHGVKLMYTNDAVCGAVRIIQDCLSLEHENDLVVIFDEDTASVTPFLFEAAKRTRVAITCLCIMKNQQAEIFTSADLPNPIQQILREVRAILICVNGEAAYTRFRGILLTECASSWARIGHMPGATQEVFEAANTNIQELSKACHDVELALARGKNIEIISYDKNGKAYHLNAEIGGWRRLPIASDSIIKPGSWGNVPSGETYIAPIENTANGKIIINGSLPNLVLDHQEEILLTFENGLLIDIQPEDSRAVRFLKSNEIQPAILAQDPNWENLAEIGIGVNRGISQLTGNMLLDEKKADTIHIAIGRNKDMGGKIMSEIHCDMVVTNPTVTIDNKPLLNRGKWTLCEQDWRENFYDLPPMKHGVFVSRSGVETDRKNHKLRKICITESGRTSYFQIGDEISAEYALKFYCELPENGRPVSLSTIPGKLNLNVLDVQKLLTLLDSFELVTIE
jgi:leucyl aminopeptidase (aminopeptidase T)